MHATCLLYATLLNLFCVNITPSRYTLALYLNIAECIYEVMFNSAAILHI